MLAGPGKIVSAVRTAGIAMLAFAAGAMVFAVIGRAGNLGGLLGGTRTERSVIEILRTDEMMFLVTTRITTLACVEIHENSLVLGERSGLLLATVRIYYGIDLERLDENSISGTEEGLVIRLPDPGMLDLSVDLSTMRFFDKRSGLQVLSDLVTGRDQELELMAMLDSTACRWASEQGLLPSRDDILLRLNDMAPMLAGYAGVDSLRFE
ncbi:DUF4230 domain-containing protein [Candidatus Fermentibacteria bacterium]|nr:DUF4230 domain-containing protein [Candidatus Fermentibacteria bacterium]